MPHITFTTNGIEWLLQDLKPGKAPGPDGSTCFTSDICNFAQSFDSGILPTDWLTANTTPIYKKGDRSLPVKYH